VLGQGMMWMARGLQPRVVPVTADARVSFARAFAIEPIYQSALECRVAGAAIDFVRGAVPIYNPL